MACRELRYSIVGWIPKHFESSMRRIPFRCEGKGCPRWGVPDCLDCMRIRGQDSAGSGQSLGRIDA